MSNIKKILFLLIVPATLLLLASSLSDLKLQPGDPELLSQLLRWIAQKFTFLRPEGLTLSEGGPFPVILQRFIQIFFLVGGPLFIIYFIISPQFRKQVIRQIIRFGTIAAAVYFLLSRLKIQESLKELFDRSRQSDAAALFNTDQNLMDSFREFAASPSRWLVVFSDIVLILLLTLLLVYFIQKTRRQNRLTSPLPQLAGVAQNALDNFTGGEDFSNTIIRCYREMLQALEHHQHIRRQETMTPKEFASYLNALGLPTQPIHQLTSIFEDVRYGSKIPDKHEEHQAIESLTAIIEECKHSNERTEIR